MYRRVVLTLYRGGRGPTARDLPVTRYTDPIVKCFSFGSVHCSEKKPPENEVTANQPAEGKKPENEVISKVSAEGKKPENEVTSKVSAEGKKPSENEVTSKVSAEGKKPPESEVTSKPPEEEKTDKKDASQPSKAEGLMNILSGMKVEVTSQKMLLAVKKAKQEEQKWVDRRVGFESASQMFQRASKGKQPEKEPAVSAEMTAAVSAVASTFPNKKSQVESELLGQLRLHKQMIEKQNKEDLDIKNVISGMQVQKKTLQSQKENELKKDFIIPFKKSLSKRLTGKRLKIFPVSKQTAITVAESSPTLWDIELAKEIATACESPARNGFEEMIQWTNEGKLWTFPINNEAGLDEEQNVEFHEHVFLDKYLEDFPKQGPIRHFMELVVCGLSKNSFLTVQQKKEHIDWFRDYFIQKEDVLRESDVYLN